MQSVGYFSYDLILQVVEFVLAAYRRVYDCELTAKRPRSAPSPTLVSNIGLPVGLSLP